MKHFEFILNTKHHGFVFQCSTMKEVMDAAEEANESFNLGIDFGGMKAFLSWSHANMKIVGIINYICHSSLQTFICHTLTTG